jgi:hypothetical protein
LISGAAIQAGVQSRELPDCREMAGYVASVVGGPEYGRLRAPQNHAPQRQPLELLRQFWPLMRDVMGLPPPKRFFRASEKPLQESHWPIVVSVVASQFILMTKDALNPRIGAALVMESAIIASKIDPETIEPGKWRIASGEDDKPPFTRLRD